jgi:hypothetical protein
MWIGVRGGNTRTSSALAELGRLLLVTSLLLLIGTAAVSGSAVTPAQALRTCVDRWNQDEMTSWGSMSVRIAIRTLNARERVAVSFGDDARPRCTVSLANRLGDNSWICREDDSGGYACPLVTSDGMPP